MLLNSQYSARKASLASAIILLGGIILRLHVYLSNRSLIIDEANLARNVVEGNWLQFLQPLKYEQYAPPIFLCLSKMAIFA